MRDQLVSWQWQGYPTFHQRPSTLWVHFFAVPVFVASALAVIPSLALGHVVAAGGAALGMVVAFAAQAVTHKREPAPPIPFEGAGDVVSRILLEQFVTWPRFVASGGWWRALRAPAPDQADGTAS
jgi:hypothetical protein